MATQQQPTSVYVGNLHAAVQEEMLQRIFGTLGTVSDVKIVRDKTTGASSGYGFIRYLDHRSADLALQSFNGRILYGQEVRVNWAFQKGKGDDSSAHFHIFVGDLSSEINDHMLYAAFQSIPECSEARVLWDHTTGRSKGYGFVSFRTREAAEEAMRRFNGEFIGQRRVRCGWAQHKQDTSANDFFSVDQLDPTHTNTNVYVGNLSAEATEADLRSQFEPFGTILEVKLYRKGCYGFVLFQRHADAVQAIVSMNGQMTNGKALKCSWGRNPNPRITTLMGAHGMMMRLPPVAGMAGMPAGMLSHTVSPMMLPHQLHSSHLPSSRQALMQQSLLAPQGRPPAASVLPQGQPSQLDPLSMYYGMYYGQ